PEGAVHAERGRTEPAAQRQSQQLWRGLGGRHGQGRKGRAGQAADGQVLPRRHRSRLQALGSAGGFAM
ncbi:hypothetical protein LTR94_038623, partial [Friedmanniomyces endolithicus]